MASKRTFYRNVFTIEILSEEPLSGEERLSDIEYLIGPGPCSGKIETTTDNEQVDGRDMARLLQDQGSEPGFFSLDEQGRDVDGDEEEEGMDGKNNNDIQEPLYGGEISVELTGQAFMQQRRTIRLEKPLLQSEVEDLARETAGNYVWDYQGMKDETIEVAILS